MRATAINLQHHALRLDGRSQFGEQPFRIQPRSCGTRGNLIGLLPTAEVNTMHSHDNHLLSRNPNATRQPLHTSATGDMAFVERDHRTPAVHPEIS